MISNRTIMDRLQDLGADSNLNTLCCTAVEGCSIDGIDHNLTIDVDNSTVNVNNYNANVAIRCDGSGSCIERTSVVAINGGNIYFAGQIAGYKVDRIKTDLFSDVFCSASGGCLQVGTIEYVDNLYCVGYYACTQINNIENVNNVYVYAIENILNPFVYGWIHNVFENVYCTEFSACYGVSIDTVEGNVIGVGYFSLSNTNINSVNGSVIGVGTHSLYESTLTSIENVKCFFLLSILILLVLFCVLFFSCITLFRFVFD